MTVISRRNGICLATSYPVEVTATPGAARRVYRNVRSTLVDVQRIRTKTGGVRLFVTLGDPKIAATGASGMTDAKNSVEGGGKVLPACPADSLVCVPECRKVGSKATPRAPVTLAPPPIRHSTPATGRGRRAILLTRIGDPHYIPARKRLGAS